ncbi:MAG: YggT family protein, partial [Pseudomonadota bacterium]
RIVPPVGKIDTASLLVAYAVQVAMTLLLQLLRGGSIAPTLLWLALFQLLNTAIMLFIYAIVINIILSWVAPGSYHPAAQLVDDLVRPVLAPFRRMIGPMGGLDLSPMIAILALGVLQIVVNNVQHMVLQAAFT